MQTDTALSCPAIMEGNIPDKAEARRRILQIEDAMFIEAAKGTFPERTHTMPLKHTFIPGGYMRELTIPAGTLIVGKIHKAPCFNVVSKGSITVITEEGRKHICAPASFRSEAGVKRVGYAHEDTVWTTFHVTDATDPEGIEDRIACSTYEEFALLEHHPNGDAT